jgi:hypothetical protein
VHRARQLASIGLGAAHCFTAQGCMRPTRLGTLATRNARAARVQCTNSGGSRNGCCAGQGGAGRWPRRPGGDHSCMRRHDNGVSPVHRMVNGYDDTHRVDGDGRRGWVNSEDVEALSSPAHGKERRVSCWLWQCNCGDSGCSPARLRHVTLRTRRSGGGSTR